MAFPLRKNHLARHSTLHVYWKNALNSKGSLAACQSNVAPKLPTDVIEKNRQGSIPSAT